jgi:hypothetical protein
MSLVTTMGVVPVILLVLAAFDSGEPIPYSISLHDCDLFYDLLQSYSVIRDAVNAEEDTNWVHLNKYISSSPLKN